MSVKQWSQFIRKSEFLRNTLLLIGGTTIAQILPFIFSPIISRLFTTEDYSVYAVFISIYSILGSVLTLRYDMAIMLPKDEQKSKVLVMLCFVSSLILSGLFFIIILLFGNHLASLFHIEELSRWLLLIPLSAFFLSVNNILINWFNRNKQYKTISVNRISRNTVLTAANIGFGFAKSGHSGLIISQVISDGIAAIYYMISYYTKVINRKIHFSISDTKAVMKEYKDFPSFTLPTTFIDTFSMQLPVLMITAYFTPAMSGSYFFAFRILAIPIALIGAAYAQTFFQKFVSFIKDFDIQGARKFLFKSWLLLLSIIIIPAMVLVFFGEPIFTLIFGSEWIESGKISSILIFYIMFAFISSPTSSTYVALRMQKYSLIFGFVVLLYRFSSFYIGYLYGDFYLAITILVICEVIEIIMYNSLAIIKLNSLKQNI